MNFSNAFKSSAVVSLMVVGGLATSSQPASAGCGWGDITCPPSEWTCPIGGCPPPPSESCLAVMTYPKEYSWSVRNDKTYPQTFWLDDQEYQLEAGRSLSFTSKVGTYSTSSCSAGTTYREPVIEFDRFSGDGRFTSHKITVNVTRYREFNFWKDGNMIKFSAESPRQ
jgi:hypothetical protein